MALLSASLVVAVFALGLERLGVVAHARRVSPHAVELLGLLRDRELDDATKERQLRALSSSLFLLTFRILLGGGLALGVPLSLVWLLDQAGLLSFREVASLLQSPAFLLFATFIGAIAFITARRRAGR
jgi:hypothetical protein